MSKPKIYGVPISRGLEESDIQGTCLLVWALAMIWKMLMSGQGSRIRLPRAPARVP
jgi:hypothetical protein